MTMPLNKVDKVDLLNSLREKHGETFVSMSDIEHPTSEFMMRYFATVITELGIDLKGMANQELLQSESFRDIGAFMQVYIAVKKVCPIPKYFAGFDIMSLMEPKPEDIVYVAAMDNFYDFSCRRAEELLGPCLEKERNLKKVLLKKEQERTELQHYLNDRAAARSKRAMEIIQMEKQIQELDGKLTELHLQEQRLEKSAVEQKKALQELRQEVEANEIRNEQALEQHEAQLELQVLREELEQMRNRHAEQDRELAEKKSALQEKASRLRFLDEMIAQEEGATESLAELVKLAAQAENQHKSLQKAEAKTKRVLQTLEAEMKMMGNLKDKKTSTKDEIIAQEKVNEDLAKKKKDLERNIQDAQKQVFKRQQEVLSAKAKCEDLKEEIEKKKQDMLGLDAEFEKQHDALYEKAAEVKRAINEALESYCRR